VEITRRKRSQTFLNLNLQLLVVSEKKGRIHKQFQEQHVYLDCFQYMGLAADPTFNLFCHCLYNLSSLPDKITQIY